LIIPDLIGALVLHSHHQVGMATLKYGHVYYPRFGDLSAEEGKVGDIIVAAGEQRTTEKRIHQASRA
jgi:hypothetical protein